MPYLQQTLICRIALAASQRIFNLQGFFTMALVSMRELLDHAAANGYGIPAFNVNNLEQVQAIMEAAKETGAPVIMQASAGARKYAGEGFLKLLIQAAVESYPEIPVVMHQDHGQSPDVCQGAINLGFSSVMMDGSLEADGKTIASYDYNVEVTQKDSARRFGHCHRYQPRRLQIHAQAYGRHFGH